MVFNAGTKMNTTINQMGFPMNRLNKKSYIYYIGINLNKSFSTLETVRFSSVILDKKQIKRNKNI